MAKTEVLAPTPGLVVRIDAKEGSTVAEGATLVTIQSMKTEISIQSESSGRISRIFVKEGEEVNMGQPVAEIES